MFKCFRQNSKKKKFLSKATGNMAAKNDITGDSIQSKILSKQGRENWDAIFNKNKKMKYLLATATWCGPCQALKKQLEKENLIGKITVVDIDEDREFNKTYEVKTVPQLIIVNDEGYDRFIGSVEILNKLKT